MTEIIALMYSAVFTGGQHKEVCFFAVLLMMQFQLLNADPLPAQAYFSTRTHTVESKRKREEEKGGRATMKR